jgi:hypothetical protein
MSEINNLVIWALIMVDAMLIAWGLNSALFGRKG